VVIAFYIFLSFLFPFLWIFYFNKKDKNPEPFLWLVFAFFLGIISAIISFYFQKNLAIFLIENWSRYLIFALIEEFFKFFLIWLFIFPQKVIDEPIDAMIYMMFSALGFAFSENLFIALNKNTMYVIPTLVYRFFGANFLHILASSLIGYGYAFSMKTRRLFPLIASFTAGTFLHFLYNYIIISLTAGFILILPILWTSFLVVLSELNYLAQNGRGKA
jgi:RsiW-degrading membrane proteinase PrsW (M82 family)